MAGTAPEPGSVSDLRAIADRRTRDVAKANVNRAREPNVDFEYGEYLAAVRRLARAVQDLAEVDRAAAALWAPDIEQVALSILSEARLWKLSLPDECAAVGAAAAALAALGAERRAQLLANTLSARLREVAEPTTDAMIMAECVGHTASALAAAAAMTAWEVDGLRDLAWSTRASPTWEQATTETARRIAPVARCRS
ncbi:hypothetical protein [Actinomycetospora lemnae]|uniref:Uncharacterized protein n=1 Tax=Actinomycetospora lemnae TaxID=3019891 RepID=A0ABT5SUW2_9PSEU|nr:hypothetical protein [Actinomycetospora sp. DW7H6]MDD7966559.1 hypothetical protein [Actinomycetospora sp. DW7H6]